MDDENNTVELVYTLEEIAEELRTNIDDYDIYMEKAIYLTLEELERFGLLTEKGERVAELFKEDVHKRAGITK